MILIKSVKPLEKFQVLLEFTTGESKIVDLEPFLHGPIFEPSTRIFIYFAPCMWMKN
jgi:Protein of unknown function (DUF2442)